jgi:hypothetical protein
MLCSLGICIGCRVDTVTGGSCAHSTMVIIRDGLIRRPSSIGSRIQEESLDSSYPTRGRGQLPGGARHLWLPRVESFRSRARRGRRR